MNLGAERGAGGGRRRWSKCCVTSDQPPCSGEHRAVGIFRITQGGAVLLLAGGAGCVWVLEVVERMEMESGAKQGHEEVGEEASRNVRDGCCEGKPGV